MCFGLFIDPRGLGIMRKETLLEVRIKGGRFDGFGDQVGNGANRDFSEGFVRGRRNKVKEFSFII